ncbi:hypothetical protein [Ottowia sp.]|uniref:hypothetical protein n=1 Tax=Ottowia sp. TaxID=1898956 RepID=UPI003C768C3E
MTIHIPPKWMQWRRLAALAVAGGTMFLAGCAVVPADPYYVGAPVAYPAGYYQSYGAPYYAPAPVYVAPPVSIGIWGNFGGGSRWHGGGHGRGWHHGGPRPGGGRAWGGAWGHGGGRR